MTEMKLAVLKLQWHVQILQTLVAKVYVSAFHTFPETSASSPAALQALLEELEAAQRLGFQTLLSPAVAEERRVLLAEEFAEMVDDIKATLIPPDILSLAATPDVLSSHNPGEKGERP